MKLSIDLGNRDKEQVIEKLPEIKEGIQKALSDEPMKKLYQPHHVKPLAKSEDMFTNLVSDAVTDVQNKVASVLGVAQFKKGVDENLNKSFGDDYRETFKDKWGITLSDNCDKKCAKQVYEALNEVPVSFIKGKVEKITLDERMGKSKRLYPNHGKYVKETQTMLLNPQIFDLETKYKDGQGHSISKITQVVMHEMGHGVDDSKGYSATKEWVEISGWKFIGDKNPPAGYKRLVLKEKGAPTLKGKWAFKEDTKFVRWYATRNPKEDFVESFCFAVTGLVGRFHGKTGRAKYEFIKKYVLDGKEHEEIKKAQVDADNEVLSDISEFDKALGFGSGKVRVLGDKPSTASPAGKPRFSEGRSGKRGLSALRGKIMPGHLYLYREGEAGDYTYHYAEENTGAVTSFAQPKHESEDLKPILGGHGDMPSMKREQFKKLAESGKVNLEQVGKWRESQVAHQEFSADKQKIRDILEDVQDLNLNSVERVEDFVNGTTKKKGKYEDAYREINSFMRSHDMEDASGFLDGKKFFEQVILDTPESELPHWKDIADQMHEKTPTRNVKSTDFYPVAKDAFAKGNIDKLNKFLKKQEKMPTYLHTGNAKEGEDGISVAMKVKIPEDGEWLLKPAEGEDLNLGLFGCTLGKSYQREVMTYHVDQMLGLSVVPPTGETKVTSEVAMLYSNWMKQAQDADRFDPPTLMGITEETAGSMQFWMKDTEDQGSEMFKAKQADDESVKNLAILDYVVSNTDRQSRNFLVDPRSKKAYAIDNGFSFGMVHRFEDWSQMLDEANNRHIHAFNKLERREFTVQAKEAEQLGKKWDKAGYENGSLYAELIRDRLNILADKGRLPEDWNEQLMWDATSPAFEKIYEYQRQGFWGRGYDSANLTVEHALKKAKKERDNFAHTSRNEVDAKKMKQTPHQWNKTAYKFLDTKHLDTLLEKNEKAKKLDNLTDKQQVDKTMEFVRWLSPKQQSQWMGVQKSPTLNATEDFAYSFNYPQLSKFMDTMASKGVAMSHVVLARKLKFDEMAKGFRGKLNNMQHSKIQELMKTEFHGDRHALRKEIVDNLPQEHLAEFTELYGEGEEDEKLLQHINQEHGMATNSFRFMRTLKDDVREKWNKAFDLADGDDAKMKQMGTDMAEQLPRKDLELLYNVHAFDSYPELRNQVKGGLKKRFGVSVFSGEPAPVQAKPPKGGKKK